LRARENGASDQGISAFLLKNLTKASAPFYKKHKYFCGTSHGVVFLVDIVFTYLPSAECWMKIAQVRNTN